MRVLFFALFIGLVFAAKCDNTQMKCNAAGEPCRENPRQGESYLACRGWSGETCVGEVLDDQGFTNQTGVCYGFAPIGGNCSEVECDWYTATCSDDVCVPVPKLGENCSKSDCEYGTTCVDGVCSQMFTLPLNASCTSSRMCVSGYCKSGRCTARYQLGEDCTSTSNCISSLFCYKSKCTEYGTLGENETCSGVIVACKAGLTCSSSNKCIPATSSASARINCTLSSSVCPDDTTCLCDGGDAVCWPKPASSPEFISAFVQYTECGRTRPWGEDDPTCLASISDLIMAYGPSAGELYTLAVAGCLPSSAIHVTISFVVVLVSAFFALF